MAKAAAPAAKSTKAAPPAPVSRADAQKAPAPVSRADAQKAREVAEARAVKAETEAKAAHEQVEDLTAKLAAAELRESKLAQLVDSVGYSSVSLGPHTWSTEEAKKLIAEEEEAMARVDDLYAKVSSERARMRTMITQQEELRDQLAAARAAIAVVAQQENGSSTPPQPHDDVSTGAGVEDQD